MTKFFKTFTAALLATGIAIPSLAAARPMTAEDLATLKRMGSVAVSPDEKWAAFDVTETEAETYLRSSALYLLALDKPEATPVRIADKPEKSEHSPAFAADGRLYAVTDRGYWVRARALIEEGRLVGIADVFVAPILNHAGDPVSGKRWSDAESLRFTERNGRETALVVFELIKRPCGTSHTH